MNGRRPLLAQLVLVAVTLVGAARFAFVSDDAYITFRYAQNLARGLGLVFNPGERPLVEGYSDPAWLLAAAVVELAGLRPDRLLPVVSTGCAVALVLRVHRAMRGSLELGATASLLGALALAASPAMGCWSTGGLETMPQALLTFLLFEQLVFGSGVAGPAVLAVLLATIRTEGLGWVGVVAAASVVAQSDRPASLKDHGKRLALALWPAVGVTALHLAWRWQVYGTLVPNTALVKVSLGPRSLARGARYVLGFWAATVTPLVMLLPLPWLLWTGSRARWAAIGLLALAFPAYAVVVGGDFMPFGRLLVPGLPFAAMILAGGLQQLVRASRAQVVPAQRVGAALVFVGVLPAFDLHVVPLTIRERLHFRLSDRQHLSELNRWAGQWENTLGFTRRGLALAQVAEPGDAVVTAAVGAVGYFSGLTVLDQHGLVTKEVAYREVGDGPLTQSPGHDKHVDATFFVKYRPRFLFARSVVGRLSANRMSQILEEWQVPGWVKVDYVPDFYEVTLPGEERAFLLVVRRRERGEDPAAIWGEFGERRKGLHEELDREFEDEEVEEPPLDLGG